MSKGSRRRPGNDKKYAENYERIFGNKEKESGKMQREVNNRPSKLST